MNFAAAGRPDRPPLSRLAEVQGRQGRRHLARHPHRRCCRSRRRVYAVRLARPAADDPDLFGRRHACRGQRAASPPPSSAVDAIPDAARFRAAGDLEAPREYPFASERKEPSASIGSNDLVDRLRLVRTPGIGPVTYRQLLARFGTAAAALDGVPDLARRGGGKAPALFARDEAEREIAQGRDSSARVIWRSGRAFTRGCWPNLRMRRRC